jgi:enoyl-CoA hydratase
MTDILLIDDPAPFVRRFTLNRPEKRNALSNELRGAVFAALALTTPSSRETFARFRDGVKAALDARDGAFGDYRTKG